MTDCITPQNMEESLRCQFYLIRKKRNCRMSIKPGRSYCPEHEPEPPPTLDGGTEQNNGRIQCPLDPKHTCYASKLEKHLEVCNSRPVEQPPYIVTGVNSGLNKCSIPRVPIGEIPKDIIETVIEKVNTLYERIFPDGIAIFDCPNIHPVVEPMLSESGRTDTSLRHLRQASTLIQLTESVGLVADNTCYIELGAGKGQLSWFMWQAWCSNEDSKSRVVLIERAAPRHKRENALRGAAEAGRVRRLRADLQHLRLRLLPDARPPAAEALVGLAKHLCGVATDYALKCVVSSKECRGVTMATCCHHRIEPASYLGFTYLQELGITEQELNAALSIVSWATCGAPRNPANAPIDEKVLERAAVGRRAKILMDWGRVMYLRDRGFEARLLQYVPSTVSLENICIVAYKQ